MLLRAQVRRSYSLVTRRQTFETHRLPIRCCHSKRPTRRLHQHLYHLVSLSSRNALWLFSRLGIASNCGGLAHHASLIQARSLATQVLSTTVATRKRGTSFMLTVKNLSHFGSEWALLFFCEAVEGCLASFRDLGHSEEFSCENQDGALSGL